MVDFPVSFNDETLESAYTNLTVDLLEELVGKCLPRDVWLYRDSDPVSMERSVPEFVTFPKEAVQEDEAMLTATAAVVFFSESELAMLFTLSPLEDAAV